jgi:hypothetical protein
VRAVKVADVEVLEAGRVVTPFKLYVKLVVPEVPDQFTVNAVVVTLVKFKETGCGGKVDRDTPKTGALE